MGLISGFHPSINGDRKVGADFFALFFGTLIGNGVFPNPSTGLQVVEGTGLQTIVRAGKGWINGYFVSNDSDYVLQHDLADGVLKRIDRVVMRLDHAERLIKIEVKKGAFASNPVAPSLQRDGAVWELVLADVLINNGATQITQANITDQRLNSAVCGIVHGLVEQVDTTTIFNQYMAWFNSVKDGTEQEIEDWQQDQYQAFSDWFATVQDILDGDVAGNLANLISQVDNRLTQHTEQDASTTQKGHVQLSNDTNSTSETLAPTMKALNEVKRYANDGKELIATAIVGKGGTATSSDNFSNLANEILNLPSAEIITLEITSSSNQVPFNAASGSTVNNYYISIDTSILGIVPKIISVGRMNLNSFRDTIWLDFNYSGTLPNTGNCTLSKTSSHVDYKIPVVDGIMRLPVNNTNASYNVVIGGE